MRETQSQDNFGRNALRNAALVVFVIALFTPFRTIAMAMAVVSIAIRLAYWTNRALGHSAMAILGALAVAFLMLQYRVTRQYDTLRSAVREYGDVSLGQQTFPMPKISRLSIGSGVTDDEFTSILELDGLDRLSELHLDNSDLTDASLNTAMSKLELSYVFIDCDQMSDKAILSFMESSPECRVIPYRRNLRKNEVKVFLGPPPAGQQYVAHGAAGCAGFSACMMFAAAR
jgi:hypothetical protein